MHMAKQILCIFGKQQNDEESIGLIFNASNGSESSSSAVSSTLATYPAYAQSINAYIQYIVIVIHAYTKTTVITRLAEGASGGHVGFTVTIELFHFSTGINVYLFLSTAVSSPTRLIP